MNVLDNTKGKKNFISNSIRDLMDFHQAIIFSTISSDEIDDIQSDWKEYSWEAISINKAFSMFGVRKWNTILLIELWREKFKTL